MTRINGRQGLKISPRKSQDFDRSSSTPGRGLKVRAGIALPLLSLLFASSLMAALGDNAPPLPATYNTSHPRLPFPDSTYLTNLANNATALSTYNSVADAWSSTNPGGSYLTRQLLIAYLANKIANPTKAAGYLSKLTALADLGGTWGSLLYSVNDGAGTGGYVVTSASANFLTGCKGVSCANQYFSIEGRVYNINSVTDAHTVVLSQNNPPISGSNLKIRIFSSIEEADLNIALIYDWLYNDLDSQTRAEFMNELDVLCTEWEENYIGVGASPYNDVFYARLGTFGLLGAIAIYPDSPNSTKHMNFMTDTWFNVLLPVWKQVFGPEGGGWHENWSDYVKAASGNGLTTFLVTSLLSWQVATGDPILTRESWVKNFAYFSMYMTRPDYLMEAIGDASRPYLISDNITLGSLAGLAEIYNDPVIRGWARFINQTTPDGFTPSAWPFYKPDQPSNAATDRSSLPLTRNFTGWGLLSMRSGWTENDTSLTLKYGDNFWSHEHFDDGGFTLFSRGLLALDSGSYRSGSASKHENQYGRQSIAHNTLTVTDPADYYPLETFLTYDETGKTIQLAPPNDGGQRRTGTLYNQHFPQLHSPNEIGDWLENWDYYHMGTLVGYAATSNYTYSAVDITAAYNNKYSATTPNTINRRYRVQKAVRHILFIPRGTSAYVVVYDQVNSTNANFVKRWILHSVNQPAITGNHFEILRNDLVTSLPYASIWPYYFRNVLTHKVGTSPSYQYQYDGKLYGWAVQPGAVNINVVGGPGKEFWVEDPQNPGTGMNWNQCMIGQCAANTEGLGPVDNFINPVPATAPHEPGSWRMEIMPATPATQDYFLNVMLATTVEDTNVPATVTVPANLTAGMLGATWTDSGKSYTVTFPQSGVGGHITIAGLVDEDLLSHAQQLPNNMSVVSGSGQGGVGGAQLTNPLLVAVKDSVGNPVPNAAVHFGVTQGGGRLSSDMALTNSQGQASVYWILGSDSVGSAVQVMADVNGLQPVAFSATITGSSGGSSGPTVTALSCSPTSLPSGQMSNCTVTLSQSAGSSGVVVSLASNSQLLTVPATITVASGSTTASFKATAGSTTAGQSAIVTATLGTTTQNVTFSFISSGPALSSISCAPATLTAGQTSSCTVTLTQAAGSGGATVALSSSSPQFPVPASIVVAGNATAAAFSTTVASAATAQTLTLTATFNGVSAATSISIVSSLSNGVPIPTNTWTMIPTNGFPPAVVGYDNLVYAPRIRKFVMWNNYHNVTSETNEAMWAYDFASNRWDLMGLNSNFHSEQLPESGHPVGMLQYDPALNVLISYCCHSGSQGYERPEHTWIFDPVGLVGRDVQPPTMPGIAAQASAVFDTADNLYILYEVGAGTWTYNPVTNVWTNLKPAGTIPTTTGWFGGMAYDNKTNKTYLFGGNTGTGSYSNDLFVFDYPSNTWTKLSPSGTLPSGRQYPGFAYDSTNNVFLMVSGQNASGILTDTWIYDPVANAWSPLTPVAGLPAASQASYQRLAYDPDDNVFALVWVGSGGYANGPSAGYSDAQTWFFRYAGSGPNAGTVTSNFSVTPGSFNRNSDAWASEPAIASSGTALYAGWAETGRPFATGNNGYYPHIYANQLTNSGWVNLGTSYLALDSEFNGINEAHSPSMTVANGTPWISWYKTSSSGQLLPNSLYAKYWNGSSWIGGPVGVVDATSTLAVQNRSQLTAIGSVPYVAFLENDRKCYPWCQFLYVKSWDAASSTWKLVGPGALNKNPATSTASTLADSVAITNDGTNPIVAWTEYTEASSFKGATAPNVYAAAWNGTSWVMLGGSLNVSATSWAYDASITYLGGQPYVAWVERSQTGVNQLFVKTWNGSAWSLVGTGTLNRDTNTGWSFRPSLIADPASNSLYVGWVEQQSLGQPARAYVARYNNGSWTSLGDILNTDPLQGSAERISLALLGGQPVAAWGEVKYGTLRQVFLKQWDGSKWNTAGISTTTRSCDLNSDGKVDATDVQLAVNQALGVSACNTADLQQNGVCDVVDVQRVINASLGQACRIGQ